MSNIIVYEGPDCAGKTSMIHRFVWNNRNRKCVLVNPTKETTFEFYAKTMIDASRDHERTYLFDRCWYSDRIYSKVRGVKSTLGIDNFRRLNELACMCAASMFVLVPEWDVLRKRYEKRGDDEVSLDELSKLHRVYDEVKNNWDFSWSGKINGGWHALR